MKYQPLLSLLYAITFGGQLAVAHVARFANSSSLVQKAASASSYWYETIQHNGQASYMRSDCKSSYQVFRNVVTDFGADSSGNTDASAAIQNAINAFSSSSSSCPKRNQNAYGTTGQPAVIYIPQGTYLMANSLQLRFGTVLMGDPTNPPTLLAASNFPNDHIIYGKDPAQPATNNFYIAIKNLVINSTNVDKDKTIAHLDWTVSQATQLTNVNFVMPNFSTGHTGVTVDINYPDNGSGYNSAVIMNDLTFNGGAVGMHLSGQQYVLKGMTFVSCTTAIVANAFDLVVHASSFSFIGTGIDAHGVSGSLTVLDTVTNQIGVLITDSDSRGASRSIILENVVNSGPTVQFDGSSTPILTGNVVGTWVHGNLYSKGNQNKQFVENQNMPASRSSVLTPGGTNYFTMKPPTYQGFASGQVVNIKNVAGLPVRGDGTSDDTANINAVLAQSIGKVVYFPAGTYMVSDTVYIPPGSRIFGDAYASAISGAYSTKFFNPDAPTAMVQLGRPGDVGVGQISDMLFTVSDVLQGCKLLEVNMAGTNPGDVGLWNSHFRVGGAAGSKVKTNCNKTPAECMAAWGLIHLTSTSSAYIENMWGWTADHDLDGGPNSVSGATVIATGRGALVEATKGTWLVGTAMEHNTLYQYNFNLASNVASIFQQSETPYWQGPGRSDNLAPAPWTNHLQASDPKFNNCGASDANCRMAWFQVVSGANNIFMYGGCVWVFNSANTPCDGNNCQTNAMEISHSTGMYVYGTNVKSITNIIRSDGVNVGVEADNLGGWTGVIAAYLYNSGS